MAAAATGKITTEISASTPVCRERMPKPQKTTTAPVSKSVGDGLDPFPPGLERLPATAPKEYPVIVRKMRASQLSIG